MKLFQANFVNDSWSAPINEKSLPDAELVLVFGTQQSYRQQYPMLHKCFPDAEFVGCSTAGEISDISVADDSLSLTAIHLQHSCCKVVSARHTSALDSETMGKQLAKQLDLTALKHTLVFSEGININGTALARGLTTVLANRCLVSGGLAGDGDRFAATYTWHNEQVHQNQVIAVGLYGDRLEVGHGSLGGWDPFGPPRKITAAKDNVLLQLDGQSALTLYKKYLGEYAADLPASGLLFPLSVKVDEDQPAVVRTILGINEQEQSMTFAGDMPQGCYAQLMKANFDRLIDGATGAAQATSKMLKHSPQLTILVSCVGRKMVLKQRIEEEVEAVKELLGANTVQCGFYSYGELSPVVETGDCALHNQTMTITTITEL
ncbi:FIST signal transduction protein [Corallincola spongiicola]|uniref:Histidine kinase n=1 Tax=Corallincola spongiicola TaxID=2520508 RepID=A0ABY1WN59_9GAMM|nr:FIST N-terminal domain-containing protein [Corallincola spongiicola]TAA44992.1 hypothetical protein EXY25_12330 [Corallincola spongiicola]